MREQFPAGAEQLVLKTRLFQHHREMECGPHCGYSHAELDARTKAAATTSLLVSFALSCILDHVN